MHLSPFTNYTIRRMLQDHVENLSEVQARSLHVSECISLDRLISSLYPKRFVAISKVHHLEMLTVLYRQVLTSGRDYASEEVELRRRILGILGIRSGDSEVMMPPIVPLIQATPFKFYAEDSLRDGMFFKGKIYGKIEAATLNEQPRLYQVATALSEQKIPCIITTAQEQYSLWVLLRSPVYSVYLKYGLTPVKKALVLHSTLCRFKQAEAAVQ